MMYVRIVDSGILNPVNCEIRVWKEIQGKVVSNDTIIFTNQIKISLSEGDYTFLFFRDEQIIHKDYLKVGEHNNGIIYNIFSNSKKLIDVDFNEISIMTPEVYRFLNYRMSYIEL